MPTNQQLSDLRSYSRQWLVEFIAQYKSESCLWESKHQDYSNHSARNEAYDRLAKKLKEVEPSPDRTMVVRKINSLRSAFRREYRKLCAKEGYETRLWYYDSLKFIADSKPRRLIDSPPKRELGLVFDDTMEYDDESEAADTNVAHAVTEAQSDEAIPTITVSAENGAVSIVKNESAQRHQQQQQQEQHAASHQHLVAQVNIDPTAMQQAHTELKVVEISALDTNSQRELQQAVNSIEQHQANSIHQHLPYYAPTTYTTSVAAAPRQEDEYDAIGINVASKLRSLGKDQRIIAEKLIGDVLFNAQLNNLNVESHLI